MLSSVECLFAPQNLFKHRFQKIGAAEVRRDDHLPVGAWPHVLAGAIKKRAVVLLPCLLLFERK
jgi:hypothetical protein